jgi:CBS domain-containing protein
VRVVDILRRKGDFVATVSPETTVQDLLAKLAEHNIGAAIVSSSGTDVAGIVSERDVVRALRDGDAGLLRAPVSQIMTATVISTEPTEGVDRLANVMTEHRIRHVPVLEEGRLVGLVSIGDIVKCRLDELELERENLVKYITSER